jgi:polysaccharide export outer membrane protein
VIDFPEAASQLRERYVAEGSLVREALVEKKPEPGLALRIRLTLGEGSLTSVEQGEQGLILHFEAGAPMKAQETAAPASEEYRVGVGDKIELTVFGHGDLTRTLEVRGDGTIEYPLIGNVTVAGKSLPEIDEEVTRSLGKDYLIDPQVSVDVREYGSRWVTIIGEIRTPGRQLLRRDMHLIDLLAEAGGFTAFANRRRIEILRSEKNDKRQKIVVNIKDIEDGKIPDLVLQSGDIVIVSRQAF